MNTKLILLSASTATIVVILVFLTAGGLLSPQQFGTACLTLMALGVLVWCILSRPAPIDADIHARSGALVPRSKKSNLILLVGLSFWLIFFLWVTRGDYWLSRLAGATVLILLLIGAVMRIRN